MSTAPKDGPYTDRELILEDMLAVMTHNFATQMAMTGDPNWNDIFVAAFQNAAFVVGIESEEYYVRLTDRFREISDYMSSIVKILPDDYVGQQRLLMTKLASDREAGTRQ